MESTAILNQESIGGGAVSPWNYDICIQNLWIMFDKKETWVQLDVVFKQYFESTWKFLGRISFNRISFRDGVFGEMMVFSIIMATYMCLLGIWTKRLLSIYSSYVLCAGYCLRHGSKYHTVHSVIYSLEKSPWGGFYDNLHFTGEKPRYKEVRWLSQGPLLNNWQSRDSNSV